MAFDDLVGCVRRDVMSACSSGVLIDPSSGRQQYRMCSARSWTSTTRLEYALARPCSGQGVQGHSTFFTHLAFVFSLCLRERLGMTFGPRLACSCTLAGQLSATSAIPRRQSMLVARTVYRWLIWLLDCPVAPEDAVQEPPSSSRQCRIAECRRDPESLLDFRVSGRRLTESMCTRKSARMWRPTGIITIYCCIHGEMGPGVAGRESCQLLGSE